MLHYGFLVFGPNPFGHSVINIPNNLSPQLQIILRLHALLGYRFGYTFGVSALELPS